MKEFFLKILENIRSIGGYIFGTAANLLFIFFIVIPKGFDDLLNWTVYIFICLFFLGLVVSAHFIVDPKYRPELSKSVTSILFAVLLYIPFYFIVGLCYLVAGYGYYGDDLTEEDYQREKPIAIIKLIVGIIISASGYTGLIHMFLSLVEYNHHYKDNEQILFVIGFVFVFSLMIIGYQFVKNESVVEINISGFLVIVLRLLLLFAKLLFYPAFVFVFAVRSVADIINDSYHLTPYIKPKEYLITLGRYLAAWAVVIFSGFFILKNFDLFDSEVLLAILLFDTVYFIVLKFVFGKQIYYDAPDFFWHLGIFVFLFILGPLKLIYVGMILIFSVLGINFEIDADDCSLTLGKNITKDYMI